jgi:hypothetical protein
MHRIAEDGVMNLKRAILDALATQFQVKIVTCGILSTPTIH